MTIENKGIFISIIYDQKLICCVFNIVKRTTHTITLNVQHSMSQLNKHMLQMAVDKK